jgi:hypothetical protein
MLKSTMRVLRRYPLVTAVLDYFLAKLQVIIISVVVALITLVYQHHATHNQIWNETGNHFQDLVKIVQQQDLVIKELTNNIYE